MNNTSVEIASEGVGVRHGYDGLEGFLVDAPGWAVLVLVLATLAIAGGTIYLGSRVTWDDELTLDLVENVGIVGVAGVLAWRLAAADVHLVRVAIVSAIVAYATMRAFRRWVGTNVYLGQERVNG